MQYNALEHSFVDLAQRFFTPATSDNCPPKRRFRLGMMDGKNAREPLLLLPPQRLNNPVAATTGEHIHGENSL